MKQTAAEWLFENDYVLNRELKLGNQDTIRLFEQAKEMEKEQIDEAFEEGISMICGLIDNKYNNETFKSKQDEKNRT